MNLMPWYGCQMSAPPRPIPDTTPSHYLTGLTALNVPSPTGSGDWHLAESFLSSRSRYHLAGDGEAHWNTNPIFGGANVHECSAELRAHGVPVSGAVWAAGHVRAVADLVAKAVLSGVSPAHVDAREFLDAPGQLDELAALLGDLAPHVPEEHRPLLFEWMKRNDLPTIPAPSM